MSPTRRELLVSGAAGAAGIVGAAGAANAAGALLAPSIAAASTTTSKDAPETETERLQRLMQLELLLVYCYQQVLASTLLTPPLRESLTPFAAQEQKHAAAWRAQLRARGAAIPSGPTSHAAANHDLAHRGVAGRLGELQGQKDALRLLQAVEKVAIGAYFVALLKISEKGLIELCCQIMANESQHDAMIALRLPPYKIQNAVPYGLEQGRQ